VRVIIFFSVLIFFLIPRYIDFPFLLCACKPSCLFGLEGRVLQWETKIDCIILQIFCNHYFGKSISDMKEIFYPSWKLICALLW
jgi:hypothetical protein